MRTHVIGMVALALLGVLTGVATVNSASVEWTGNEGNGLWSDTNNWEGWSLPGTNDIAVFGGVATNGPHNVIVDAEYQVQALYLTGGVDRVFEFFSSGTGKLSFDPPLSVGLYMSDALTTDLVFNVPFYSVRSSTLYLRNYSDHTLHFATNFGSEAGARSFFLQGGKHEFSGSVDGVGGFYIDTAGSPDVDVLFRHTSFSARQFNATVDPGATATVHFAADATFSRYLQGSQLLLRLQATEHGSADRTVSFGRQMEALGDPALVQFMDNEPGDTGRFILQSTGYGAVYGMHSLEMNTRSNTVIKMDAASEAEMTYYSPATASNRSMRISGEGHFWKSNTGLLTVRTTNTYSGRTMISAGTLALGFYDSGTAIYYGQLPTSTVVELGAGATFNLDGLDQTIGGLTGFKGLDLDEVETFGAVALGGGALTVNSTAGTTFGGSIGGIGALVKAGAETFTLSAGYTNEVGCTVRAEQGTLSVSGTMDMSGGDFELAGGFVTADTLPATGSTWTVTLTPDYEGQTIVDTTDADITDAQLTVALADGYDPDTWTTYTLLRASSSIEGASDGGILFGYEDGSEIETSGFLISWAPGSEAIVLTKLGRGTAIMIY